MFNILSCQRNENQNHFEIPSYLSEWLRSKSQVIALATKDVEQEEHSTIAGGSAKLHSKFGNQYGSFLENWELI